MSVSTLAKAAVCLSSVAAAASFDYVIVGGGTSGLVVANRLSELPGVTVAVIEAGPTVLNNTNVTSTSAYGDAFGTYIDWAYQTVVQKYANNETTTMRAGKALGGTSTFNGMAVTRAEDSQVDAWEKLGNGNGWNWEGLWPYYVKSTTLEVPDAAQIEAGASYNADYYSDGPQKVGWPYAMVNGSLHTVLNDTYAALDVPYNPDVNGGKMTGFSEYPKFLDTAENIRLDAARAYYYPIDGRPNLQVFLNTYANKIVFANGSGDAVATGVEVSGSNGTYIISANKEVILSAGSLKSPVILEYSGIGNPDILAKYDIPVVVDLPTVGENLQDQMNTGLSYSNNGSFTGEGDLVAYPNVDQIFGAEQVESIASDIKSKLSSYAEAVSAASGNVTKAADLKTMFELQYSLIFDSKVPIAEVLITPYASTFSVEYWALLPFARGNIHISSANTSVTADINPNYFMLDWDSTEQIGVAKFIRELLSTAPLSDEVKSETKPGLKLIGKNATDAEWDTWIKSTYRSNFHPVATAAMMPREIGGVVSDKLIVYGTSNVRVVDASVLPYQVCGHLVSTLYAVAEKASDIIKADI